MAAGYQNVNGHFSLRAAALIIEDDRVLLAKSDMHDCFYTMGGEIRQNESSNNAILRECYEETGCQFEIDRLAFVQERFYRVGNGSHHEIAFFYLMKTSHFELFNGMNTDQANERLYWIPIDELETVKIVPEFLRKELKDIPSEVTHIISYE